MATLPTRCVWVHSWCHTYRTLLCVCTEISQRTLSFALYQGSNLEHRIRSRVLPIKLYSNTSLQWCDSCWDRALKSKTFLQLVKKLIWLSQAKFCGSWVSRTPRDRSQLISCYIMLPWPISCCSLDYVITMHYCLGARSIVCTHLREISLLSSASPCLHEALNSPN